MTATAPDSDLRQLLDRQAILDCVQRFFRGLDRHDSVLIRSAVYSDASMDYGARFRGDGDAIALAVHSPSEEPWDASQHNLTNHFVEFDAGGDSAHAESYAVIFMRRRDGTGVDATGARYVDRFERRGGVWKIAARVFVWEWGAALPSGSVDGPGSGFAMGRRDLADISYRRPLRPAF